MTTNTESWSHIPVVAMISLNLILYLKDTSRNDIGLCHFSLHIPDGTLPQSVLQVFPALRRALQ